MELTLDEVRHVAGLARLGLTDAEQQRMREQLSSLLGHINALNDLDTDAIPPTASIVALTNVWRDDIVQESLPRDRVLMNAPRQDEGCFEVDTPLGGEENAS